MNPVVSIIIPAYNAERYLGRALASALGQTYQQIEVVVVDDGSTDGTAEVARSTGDRRVVYMRQENAGQGRARNLGIERSRGAYVTFLDADDWYLPTKVECEVAFLRRHPGYQVVYCNALHYHAQRHDVVYRKIGRFQSGQLLPELLKTSYINPNTVMVARQVFSRTGLFNETRYYPEDWEMWLKIALAGFRVGYLDEDLVMVELRDDSNTTMEIQWILKSNAIEMFRKLFPQPMEIDGVRYSADRIVRELKLKLALAYLMVGQRRAAAEAVVEAVPIRPLGRALSNLLALVPAGLVRWLWQRHRERASMVVSTIPAK